MLFSFFTEHHQDIKYFFAFSLRSSDIPQKSIRTTFSRQMSMLRFSAFLSQSIMYLILGCSCYKCDWLLLYKPAYNYICPLLLNYFYIKDGFHIFSSWKNIHLPCDCTQGTVTAVTHKVTKKWHFLGINFLPQKFSKTSPPMPAYLKKKPTSYLRKKKAVKEDKQAHHSAETPQISTPFDGSAGKMPQEFLPC